MSDPLVGDYYVEATTDGLDMPELADVISLTAPRHPVGYVYLIAHLISHTLQCTVQ